MESQDYPEVVLTREQASRLTGEDFSHSDWEDTEFVETQCGRVRVTLRSENGAVTGWLPCLTGQRSVRWEKWMETHGPENLSTPPESR